MQSVEVHYLEELLSLPGLYTDKLPICSIALTTTTFQPDQPLGSGYKLTTTTSASVPIQTCASRSFEAQVRFRGSTFVYRMRAEWYTSCCQGNLFFQTKGKRVRLLTQDITSCCSLEPPRARPGTAAGATPGG